MIRPPKVAGLLAIVAFPALAFEGRLLDSSGKPVAGAQVSVVGQAGSARTSAEGRFTLNPDPAVPATLIIVGSRGEVFPPVHIETITPPMELRLEQAFRESVTVSSGATPNIEAPPAAAATVIGNEDIEERRPAHLIDALERTPGITRRGEGPASVPVVRGLAGGRTLLMLDDARIVAERRAGPSATFLDPFMLGSIEIARGPGSVSYGSDALGGVVHMRPRDPVPGQPEFRFDLWTAFGGERSRSVAVERSFDLFGGAMLASIHTRSGDDAEAAGGVPILNSSFKDRGGLLRFVRDTSWGRIRAGYLFGLARDVGAPAADVPAVRTYYPDERANLATFALDAQTRGFFSAVALRASLGSYSITTNRETPASLNSSAVKARDASVRISGTRHHGQARLMSGVDLVTRFNLRASGSIDDAGRHDFGAFTTYERRIVPLLALSGGARVDHVSSRNHGGTFGDRSTSHTAFSGHLSTTAGPFRTTTATLQVATGFRDPTLSDRYFRGVSGRGFITGNPELDPERSLQLDASLHWTGKRTNIALFAYDYQIRHLVERFRSGANFFFRNRGEAQYRGLELDAALRLPRNLEAQLGAAIARGEDADTGAALDDVSAPVAHLTLRWASARASAFASASAYARDDRPGPVEVERPGYAQVDAGAGLFLTPALELRVALKNLNDVARFGSPDANAALAQGRSVTIGISGRL
jgi:outer membrane receptor protein involved in Fe transport